jgi:zinc transport system substrate-binding protein
MFKKLVGVLLLFSALITLSACGSQNASSEEEGLKVITTFFPMYDFTRNIVGDAGTVTMMIPAGTEAHDYEPSARDMANIESANVFVYSSPEMETWVKSALNTVNTDTNNVKIIKASQGIELMDGDGACLDKSHDHSKDTKSDTHSYEKDTKETSKTDSSAHSKDTHSSVKDETSYEESHGHSHSHEYDPHVWLSPKLAIKQVETIRDGLIAAYPQAEDTFRENAAAYIKKLEALDQEFHDALKGATQRDFVTQHAAFAYLAREYDLHQVAISGISPDQEPSAARLAELKHFVKDNNIKIIYFEENASDRVAQTLAKETGVELAVLNPLEGLTQERIDAGEDYISVMRSNLQALLKTIN